jgi:predicted nucleic acid-binding protein
MPEPVLVCDTVSLGNFLLADAVGLLVRRYRGRIRVTSQVLDELVAGARTRPALRAVHGLLEKRSIVQVDLGPREHQGYAALIAGLGRGEASCIALAGSRGWTVVTDDRAARSHCAQSKLAYTGTIGILRAACIDGQLLPEEADRVLARMAAAGFYSPVSRISLLLP